VSTLAGGATAAFQDSTDGTGGTARFSAPRGAVWVGGVLYVCDGGNARIRRVDTVTGETTTLAGDGTNAHQDSTDGTGATARFTTPFVVTQDAGFLYVGESAWIRKVSLGTGVTTTLAGDGTNGFRDSTDGTGATARFNVIIGLIADGTFLYVGDADNNRIRKVHLLTGETTTLAGDGTPAFQDSTDGTGTTAQFDSPRQGVIHDGALFLTESTGHRVRRIDIATGNTVLVAGSTAGFADGAGAAAQFNTPYGITAGGGSLWVVDQGNNRVRKIE
jgi:hypothetical protein